MNESEFWKSTPRKIDALMKVHREVNSYDNNDNEAQEGFIDDVIN